MRFSEKAVIFFFSLLACICCISSAALIQSSGASNGGVTHSTTISYFETGNNLLDWDTTDSDYAYYSGGVRSSVTTNGRTYLEQSLELEDSRTVHQDTLMETTKTGIVDEAGFIWSSHVNQTPVNCEYGGMTTQDGETGGAYPETNSAAGRSGIIGTGEDTVYQGEYLVDNVALGLSMAAHGESGIAWEEEDGTFKAGLDVNLSALQYIYKHRHRTVSIGTLNDASKTADIVRQFVWEITANDIVGNGTYVSNSTVEASD